MPKSAPYYRLKDRELGRPTSSQRYKTCARCGAHRDFERRASCEQVSQTSPNKTSSVSEISFGAKSPIALCAGSGLESRVFLVLRLLRMCIALL